MRVMNHSLAAAASRTGNPAAEAVSVVMPVRNEERNLAESVRSVLGQDYPGELRSCWRWGPPGTGPCRSAADRRRRPPDHRGAQPERADPGAVNAAIKASRHSIVARVDGHALLPQGYLRTAVRELRQTGAANVGGIMAAQGVTPFQQAVAWAMTSRYGVGAAKFHTGGRPGAVDSVYLGVYRRPRSSRSAATTRPTSGPRTGSSTTGSAWPGGMIWFLPELRVSYRPRATVRALASSTSTTAAGGG